MSSYGMVITSTHYRADDMLSYGSNMLSLTFIILTALAHFTGEQGTLIHLMIKITSVLSVFIKTSENDKIPVHLLAFS